MSSWNPCDTIDVEHYGNGTSFYWHSDSTTAKPPLYSDSSFDGVCVDTGDQIGVCGHHQELAYRKHMRIPFVTRHSSIRFKFGDMVVSSTGIMKFRFPCPQGGFIDIINKFGRLSWIASEVSAESIHGEFGPVKNAATRRFG